MSYQKLEKLIDQAPGLSQWWKTNKSALHLGALAWVLLLFPLVFITGISGLMVCFGVLFIVFGDVPLDRLWMVLNALLVFCGCFGAIRLGNKILKKCFTYKDFKLKYETFWEDYNDDSASWEFVRPVLQHALKIENSNICNTQLKHLLMRLPIFKDMDLPESWWVAVSKELSNCTTLPTSTNEENTQEQPNHVSQTTITVASRVEDVDVQTQRRSGTFFRFFKI